MTNALQQPQSHEAVLLRSIGEKLFGSQWQSELSGNLSVNERSLRRWLSGQDEIPSGVWGDLRRIIETRWINFRELEYQIRDLSRVAVYSFDIFDSTKGQFVRNSTRSKRTAADIEQHGDWKIIPGTQQLVDRRSLDEHGRYIPPSDGAEWSVGDVAATTEGYGFNILDRFRAPVAAFSYPDRELAERSHDLVAAALGDAVSVLGHSR
jgi:hypothetical protein